MILLVDAGNTRIKWRIVAGRQLCASGVAPTAEAADLAQVWQPHRLNGAVVSCVAGSAVQAELERALRNRVTGPALHWVTPAREKFGLINYYTAPETLGVDRYAALIAAAHLKLGDCVVASVGTATTVDMLDRNGAFLGGVILPGPDLMRSALLGGTGQIQSRVRDAAASLDSPMPPRDTVTAVEMGIALAQAGAIRSLCEQMPALSKQPPLVVLTGGARAQIRAGLQMELIEIEDLVLEGLAWIALETFSLARGN
jgi:type III pantothenate kinase